MSVSEQVTHVINGALTFASSFASKITKQSVYKSRGTSSLDGQIAVTGQLDLANFDDWNISTEAEYEFSSDTFRLRGTATYEHEDLSFSFSGSHDSDGSKECNTEFLYRF